MSETAGQSRVTIERWINTYVVPASTGRPSPAAAAGDLPRRIDRSVSEELASSCAAWLQGSLDLSSPAVWRIRELHLDFVMDAAASREHSVVQTWAERVAMSISQVIDEGSVSEGVLCFENWGAYLAQFALDLAAGRAWDLWYYEEFFSLGMLPVSRTIAEAFTREPEHGAEAILNLAASKRLDEILAVLSSVDAGTIYRRNFGGETEASSGELSRWCGRLLELSLENPNRSAQTTQSNAHQAIRSLAQLAVRYPGAERDVAARAAVSGLLELRCVLTAIESPLAADRLVRDLVERRAGIGETFQAAISLGAESPERGILFLAQIGMGDPDWAVQAAAELLRDRFTVRVPYAGESILTAIGGVFLLGPALLELNLEEIADAAAGDGQGACERAALVRHIMLAKCVDRSRVPTAFSDPALRILSTYQGKMLSNTSEDAGTFTLDDLNRARIIFARNLIASTGCEGHCLLAEVIPLSRRGCEALVLRDVARNVYLYACLWPVEIAEKEKAFMSAIDLVRELTGNIPWILLSEHPSTSGASSLLKDKIHGLVLIREGSLAEIVEVLSITGCINASTSHDKIAQLLAPSARELEAFSTDWMWPGISIDLDLLCRLLARAALRGFARKLKGFQANAPDYLRENFLEGVSTMRFEHGRIEVELPPSPLSLVLQMSGLSRQHYVVPWLSGREIWLMPWQA